MKRFRRGIAIVLPLTAVAACADREAEAAVEGFFNWMMLMVAIAILAFVLWALVLAGGIAAIIAGMRRMNRQPAPPPPASQTPAQPAALPSSAEGWDAPPLPPERPPDNRGPDVGAILLIVFGGLLVLGAGPIVLFNGDRPGGGWFSVSVPLPMLLIAGALVWLGLSRSRKR